MNFAKRGFSFSAIVFVLAALSHAEENEAPGPSVPPEARQFDFWVGDWEVTTPDGKVAGHNTIERILGGRVLQENWSGSGGYVGKSFNLYDASLGKWRQFWVDKSGLALVLTGGWNGTRMALAGERVSGEKTILDRITWTPNDDGTLRQLWEVSEDGGNTWQTIFDGLYRRRK